MTAKLTLLDWDERAQALLGPLAGCYFGEMTGAYTLTRCVGLRINVAEIKARPVSTDPNVAKAGVNVPHGGAFITLGKGKTWPEAFKRARAVLKQEQAEIDKGCPFTSRSRG